MIQLKYLHSQLTAESVQQLIALHYSFAEIVSCKFYDRGLHDNYLVENKSSRFILRIYRNEWRSPNKVMFELELLDYLRQQDCPVAAPLPTTEGKLGVTISCPEGDRILALFEYAEGFPPDINDLERISNELGKTVAKVHAATTGFSTHYTRPTLDTSYLLDHSLKVIEPYLDKDKKKYLDNLQQKIHAKIPIISQEENTFGICTGDINFRNFHIDQKDKITLFDFDQCGFGFRAFEIGKFASSIHGIPHKKEYVAAFINGYQEIRKLSEEELTAIPYYEMMSILWVLTIYVDNANRIGHTLLRKQLWDDRIDRLKAIENVTTQRV